MHERAAARLEVDDARHGAVRVREAELVGPEDALVRGQVGAAVHVGREDGGGVDDVEGHGAVDVRRPGGGPVAFDNGLARRVVAGDVVRESGEALGELGVVAGSRVGC